MTWDQRKEMAYRSDFAVEHGVQIYFGDPTRLGSAESNENANGLLRHYLPKGADLHSPADLLEMERSPQRMAPSNLSGLKPSEKLEELLALTGRDRRRGPLLH